MRLLLIFALLCFLPVNKSLAQDSGSAKTSGVQDADIDIHDLVNKMVAENLKPPSRNMSKLDKYFARYCDYTGGLGLGFVASHTYDFRFRQHLKKTKDLELKRLFVLQHLYRELDFAVRDYERGIIDLGKGSEERTMTPEEKIATRNNLLKKLDDLESFDPKDPEREIAQHRAKLK